jgi:DNA-binding Lrp family transcriptional regulator
MNSQRNVQSGWHLDRTARCRWRFGQPPIKRAALPMDEIDHQLIALLRDDARMSVATIAKKLGVARGTVQNRIGKLEADGTIVGYTVRLRPQAEERRLGALMTIAVEGNRPETTLRALRGDPAVVALYSTNGRWDFVAELRADTLEEFDRVLSRIRRIDGISNTETSLLLSAHKL